MAALKVLTARLYTPTKRKRKTKEALRLRAKSWAAVSEHG